MEKALLQDMKVMEKKLRDTYEGVMDVTSDEDVPRWKDDKVATVNSKCSGGSAICNAKRFNRAESQKI